MTTTARPAATVTLTIPRALWWTSNDRIHWATKAERTRNVRHAAERLAHGTGPFNRVNITATVHYPTDRRADPHNIVGTVIKAAIDGLVDAGTLPDDDAKHLTALAVQQGEPTRERGTYRLTLDITEAAA